MMIKEAKALARKALVGKYGTVILAGICKCIVIFLTVALCIFGIGLALCYIPIDLNIPFLPQVEKGSLALVVAGVIIFTVAFFLLLILGVWFEMGEKRLILNICRGYHYSVGDIFYGFSAGSHPWRYFGLYLLKDFFLTSVSLIPAIFNTVKIATISNIHHGPLAVEALVHEVSGIGSGILWIINLLLTMFLIFSELLLVDRKSESIIDSIKDSISLTKGHRLDIIWLITFSFILWKILMVICPLAGLWIVPYINTTMTVYYLMCRNEAYYLKGYDGSSNGNGPQESFNSQTEGFTQKEPEINANKTTNEDTSDNDTLNNGTPNNDTPNNGTPNNDTPKKADDISSYFDDIINNSK